MKKINCTGCYAAETYGGRCKYHPSIDFIPITQTQELWEILIPTTRNNGQPIHTRFHRIWDQKIRELSNGLTIFTPVKGEWINENFSTIRERMIPVRFLAYPSQIESIIQMTLIYYEQDAIMAYKISDEIIMKYNDEN